METLGKVKHENLVSLLGYCSFGEKLLVYEYMVNGSLDLWLRNRTGARDVLEVEKGFEGALGVDCQGQGGGLVMFWRNKEEVTIQSYSNNHIDVLVNIQGWPPFRLTGKQRLRAIFSWSAPLPKCVRRQQAFLLMIFRAVN
ncbi:hypothetical protein POM88_009415 [Heracleum sosnowskyi]|uniref:Serine-threonine/tyrosine-protein kinase catalytic domain-containing protein n=1 Tax=Heracleum sosnowskyi TaxID=360622 RepID=A0AAD8JBW3_9APIA|nr:hypothetical protein POM88_009415 [Heracleum sosnowskyi]